MGFASPAAASAAAPSGWACCRGSRKKVSLSKADYISTVSGGGYIGSWLQGVAYHDPAHYEDILNPQRESGPSNKDPITFLRKYSNYLAPRNGLSLDALVIPLIWFRNMMLNQVIIILALMAIYIALLGRRTAAPDRHRCHFLSARKLLILAGLFTLVAVLKIGAYLRRIVKREFAPADEARQMGGKVVKKT